MCGTARLKHFNRITRSFYITSSKRSTQVVGVDCQPFDTEKGTCDITIATGTLRPFNCSQQFFFVETPFAQDLGEEVGVLADQVGPFDLTDLAKVVRASSTTINLLTDDSSCLEQSYTFSPCQASNSECLNSTAKGAAFSCPSFKKFDPESLGGNRRGLVATDDSTMTDAERELVPAWLAAAVAFLLKIVGSILLEILIDHIVSLSVPDNPKSGCARELSVVNDGVASIVCLDGSMCAGSKTDPQPKETIPGYQRWWAVLLMTLTCICVCVCVCLVVACCAAAG